MTQRGGAPERLPIFFPVIIDGPKKKKKRFYLFLQALSTYAKMVLCMPVDIESDPYYQSLRNAN